jgi:cytochrome P450
VFILDIYSCADEKRTIPSGVNVVILPYVIHKDPEHFPNPEEFIPERFLAENCLKRHPCAYIPFSYGARNCIGQKFGMNEAKVIISYLLRNYNWRAVDKRDEIALDLDLVIRPMNGLRFKITKR